MNEKILERRHRRLEAIYTAKFRERGFTSYFWVTANQDRATAMQRMVEEGKLRRLNQGKHGFPLMEFEVVEPISDTETQSQLRQS